LAPKSATVKPPSRAEILSDIQSALLRDTEPALPIYDPAVEMVIADICRVRGWKPTYAQREMVKLEVAGKWQRRPVQSPQTHRRADAWRPVAQLGKRRTLPTE
jgi:hypothetical protein